MGVKQFKTILDKYGDGKELHISELSQIGIQRIAIDMLIYIYRCYHRKRSKNTINLRRSIVKTLKELQMSFNKYGIHVIFIIDGLNKPEEKHKCLEIRKRRIYKILDIRDFFFGPENEYSIDYLKKKYSNHTMMHYDMTFHDYVTIKLYSNHQWILLKEYDDTIPTGSIIKKIEDLTSKLPDSHMISSDDFDFIKRELYKENIDILIADGEGESLCCGLLNSGQVDAIMSEDSDVFVYGGKTIMREYNISKKTFKLYTLDILLNNMNLNFSEFVGICICIGTDYSDGVKLGFQSTLELLKRQSLTGLISKYDNENVIPFSKIKDIFIPSEVYSLYSP